MKTLDKIRFEVNVDKIEGRIEHFAQYLNEREEDNLDFPCIYQAIVANAKANEEDETVVVSKGTRRPGNRAERRKATAHVKNRRKRLAVFSMDEIRPTGKVKNTGIRSYLKGDRVYSRKDRRKGKKICRAYSDMEDKELRRRWYTYNTDMEKGYITEDDYDQDFNPYGYTNEEFFSVGGENLHGDFSNSETERIYSDYHYWIDPVLSDQEASWEEISNLKKEIAKYKDFLGEFNLNTLYERWLKDNS